jgi:hypothetical protein
MARWAFFLRWDRVVTFPHRDAALAKREKNLLLRDGHIQFVEQPMPATADPKDLAWVKERAYPRSSDCE